MKKDFASEYQRQAWELFKLSGNPYVWNEFSVEEKTRNDAHKEVEELTR